MIERKSSKGGKKEKMKFKKFLIMFVALSLFFTALPLETLTTVEGATVQGNDTVLQGKQIETIYGSALKGSDGSVYYEGVITAVHFQPGGTYTTKKTNGFQCKELIGVDESGNQSWLYCVEKDTGFSRDGYSGTNIGNSRYLRMDRTGTLAAGLNKLASDKGISGLNGVKSIAYILTATIYGWQPDATMPAELSAQGLNEWDWYFGTQVVIWEFQQGIRQTPTQCNGNGFNSGDAIYSWLKGRPAEYAYNYVLKMMAQHRTIPSFSTDKETTAPTYTLKWNSTNKRYETTLTDTAGYAFNLEFEDSNIKCVKSGNKYTIYTTKTITSPVLSTTQKEMHISANQELLVWGKSGKQTMVTGMQDPVMFYMKLQTDKPTITINKTGTTADDIANRLFYVYKDNDSIACLTLTTDSTGYASGSLPGEGIYRVVEQNTSKYNVTYSVQTFTYPGSAFDANNNITINVDNALKVGYLQLKKESDDGVVQGLQFQIAGNDTTITGTTNADGYLVVNGSSNIALIPGTYTVTEINIPERYEQPEALNVNITKGKTIIRTVTNTLKPTCLKIVKQSEDGIVAGMQFRITGTTATGKRVDISVITGPDGTITTELEQGTYTVSEVNVSSKYYAPSSQMVTLNDGNGKTLYFTNELRASYLRILKTSEDGIVRGMKFRVQGNGIDITGFTNEDGYVVFGEKAYWLTGATVESSVKRIAVASKDATVAEIFSDLGLSSDYSIGGGVSATWDEILGSNKYGNGSITGSGRIMIRDPNGQYYAQIVFKGSTYDGSAADGFYGVTAGDLSTAKNKVGQSMTGSYSQDIAIAAYDLDRDGIITQSDIDILQDAYDNQTDLIHSTTLILEAGDYRVTEIEVSDRYTDWFDQTITVSAGETKVVQVKNYLKKGGVIIVKKAEDGILAGHQFQLAGKTDSGKTVDMVVTTDENGLIVQALEPGDYNFQEINVPNRYYPPQYGYGFHVIDDYAIFEIENILKPSTLQLIKESEDNVISNISFRIQSVATTNGDVIDRTATTDEDGSITLDLPQGTYVVTELDVADRYVEPMSQRVVLTAGETTFMTFTNVLKVSTLKIVKTSEDGIVEDVQFQVTGTTLTGAEYSEVFTTDANGLIVTEIPQGTYTVTEIQDNRYLALGAQTITLTNDETISIAFHNVLKGNWVIIAKESEDGVIAGIPFLITGMGDDGVEVNMNVTTGSKGTIGIILKPGTYTITELDVDEKFIIPEQQEVTIAYDQPTQIVTFQNILKKFQVTLTKRDSSTELGLPQGDWTMAGAVYGLYQEDGTLIAEYTTDETGQFTTEAIPCEVTYIQEITAPKGYLLDETQYWLESSLAACYLEITNLTLDVTDYPVTGSISILKKMGTEAKWEYEPGAVFEVYLKSAGSYEAANEWERDLLVTDEATGADDNNLGEATTGGETGTKDLPMGTYIVHQVSGSDGFHLVEDIEVTLTEENLTVHLELLNLSEVEMPNTGGRGTMPFVIGGILCMLMACSVAITKMRNCKNK